MPTVSAPARTPPAPAMHPRQSLFFSYRIPLLESAAILPSAHAEKSSSANARPARVSSLQPLASRRLSFQANSRQTQVGRLVLPSQAKTTPGGKRKKQQYRDDSAAWPAGTSSTALSSVQCPVSRVQCPVSFIFSLAELAVHSTMNLRRCERPRRYLPPA